MATLFKKMFSSLRDETDPVIAAIATLLTTQARAARRRVEP